MHKISFEVPGVLPEALQPVGLRVTADGSKAYVALGPANRVAVVDAETFEVEDYLLVGQRVWQLGFSPDGKFLYTTNGNSNDISIIDVGDRRGRQVGAGRRAALGRRRGRMYMRGGTDEGRIAAAMLAAVAAGRRGGARPERAVPAAVAVRRRRARTTTASRDCSRATTAPTCRR